MIYALHLAWGGWKQWLFCFKGGPSFLLLEQEIDSPFDIDHYQKKLIEKNSTAFCKEVCDSSNFTACELDRTSQLYDRSTQSNR